MKTKRCLLLLLLLPFYGFSQIVTVDYIMKREVIKQEPFVISPHGLKFYQTILETGFDKFRLRDSKTVSLLQSKTIYKVELYYSAYKSSGRFSQEELNRKRLRELQKKLPGLFENNAIEWKLIEQQDEGKETAKRLFHGFVFYSREPRVTTRDGKDTGLTTKEEIDIIKSYLGDTLPTGYKSAICFTYDTVCDTLWTSYPDGGITKKKTYTGKYWPRSKRKKAKGILYDKKGIWNRRKEYKEEETPTYKTEYTVNCETRFSEHYITLVSEIDDLSKFSLTADTVVLKTMNRQNLKNPLVVEDVTGSMHPYLAQTFKWRRLLIAGKKVKNFAFFNDGDDRPDGPIGNSHGVYNVLSDSIDAVETVAYATMKKGYGGDGPENNIEATVRGIENSGAKVSDVIMVADNFARVRDMSIIENLIRLEKPVHVIVCGSRNSTVNYQYIDIARKTGGSIHTINEEITFRAKLNEGETITVGGQTFTIKNGELVLE